MTVLANRSISSARTNTRASARADDTPSEFEGLWINVGVNVAHVDEKTGEEGVRFLRLNRGIAVPDLKEEMIYQNTGEQRRDDVLTINSMVQAIQEAGLELEQGESKEVKLVVRLYRKQEETTASPADVKADVAAMKQSLFA